ncbi:MAG: hypothetical protein KBC17_02495 [Candidatus Pacebacteria bacterium]|nr:hypothetical protein [Candidatus Paceibacterota bacterium]
MKNKIAVFGATVVGAFAPIVAFAQSGPVCLGVGMGRLEGIICKIYDLIKIAIPVLILGAVLWFIWGIVKFMTAHDAEEKGAARGTMIHGIIGFAVILGLWGLVLLLLNTFGIGSGGQNITTEFPTF